MGGARTGGIVLCGGESRRMGRSKAWLEVGAERLLPRMVRVVGEVAGPVVVAAKAGQTLPELPPHVRVVNDAPGHEGPLAGIAAGLAALDGTCDSAFVTSCDAPLLRVSFVERLIGLLADHAGVVPWHEGRLHPTTAVYRTSTRGLLLEMLDRGAFRAQEFVERCGARVVEADDLRSVDARLDSLWNVNDPADLAAAIRRLETTDG